MTTKHLPSSVNSKKSTQIKEVFEEYLNKLGLRQTKQRRIIIDAVLASGKHVDVETIAKQVKKLDRAIGLATVYRALKMMTEANILVERHFGTQRAVFEFADKFHEQHHDHLICNQCGAIIEFFDEEVEQKQVQIAAKLGFELKDHKMELFADCLNPTQCKKKAQNEIFYNSQEETINLSTLPKRKKDDPSKG